MTAKIKKEVIKKDNYQQKEPELIIEQPEEKSVKSSRNFFSTGVIITLGLLFILTIAVLIGLELQKRSNHQKPSELLPSIKEAELKNDESLTPTPHILTKEEIIAEAFYYPNSQKTEVENELYCVQLLLHTDDSVSVVYHYYEDLIDINDWETGPVGMQTGDKSAFLYIYQDDFNADLNLNEERSEAGLTKIEINVTCKNGDEITSTFNIPSVKSISLDPTPVPDSHNQPIQPVVDEDFILPFSNSRVVSKNDLQNLSPWELKVARNEIYARHGRAFVHQDLACYFQDKAWYGIDPLYSEKNLSKLETSNAVLILNYEKEINSPLINKDTGCR